MTEADGALRGVRVLDLAEESGVYCGKLLADMGADVIKVEPPGGASMRDISPFYAGAPNRNRSLFFWHYNTNKRSIALNLDAAEDRERLLQLAATTDVLIETMAPGHLDALGVGATALTACNPRLTLVSITPFGQTGPYRNHRGSDLVTQALGGMVYVNGAPNEPPLQGLGLQAYHSASTYAAIGTLLALLARDRLGRGQWIDVSIQACVAAALEHASSFFHEHGTVAERQGSLHWTRCFRVGRCADGHVMHCALGDWTSLLEWVKADGKAQDLTEPAWESFDHRRDHCVRLFDVIDAWAKEHTVADLVDGAQLRRLPYAAVLPPQALRNNPQLLARGFFVGVQHEELGRSLTYPGAPYVFSRTPWRIRRRPPVLGEHTQEVFVELAHRAPATDSKLRTPGLGSSRLTTQDLALGTGRALDGVRVIDFTWVVAGPVATRILADHGAEVIKIERRDALDLGSRRRGLTGNLNRGKQSIVINMNSPRGVGLAKQLITTADVVIDNFSARVMRNWGLDYATLRCLKPNIIAVSMSGFGHSGPHEHHVSYGPTLQALSGYTWLMRHPGGEPTGWGFSYADMAGGYSGALAVLMALWHRRCTGEGQHIDLSQFENIVALLGPRLLDILVNGGGASLEPAGNRSQEAPAVPHGVYRCLDEPGEGPAHDRWCAVAVFGANDWVRFCRVLGDPAWTREARFSTERARLANAAALDTYVQAWTASRTAEDVMSVLQDAGIAAGVVANAQDLCRDPQLRAHGYWARIDTPQGEGVELDGVPFKMSATPGAIRAPGPLLGEHTDTILRRVLRMADDTIAELRSANIVA